MKEEMTYLQEIRVSCFWFAECNINFYQPETGRRGGGVIGTSLKHRKQVKTITLSQRNGN